MIVHIDHKSGFKTMIKSIPIFMIVDLKCVFDLNFYTLKFHLNQSHLFKYYLIMYYLASMRILNL